MNKNSVYEIITSGKMKNIDTGDEICIYILLSLAHFDPDEGRLSKRVKRYSNKDFYSKLLWTATSL